MRYGIIMTCLIILITYYKYVHLFQNLHAKQVPHLHSTATHFANSDLKDV